MYQNYNNNQTTLSIALKFKIPNNSIAITISRFVDSIPSKLIYLDSSTKGRPAYDPRMLLKVILFAYTRQTFSGRKIEALVEDSIAAKWLVGDPNLVPSYRTFNRFRSSEQMTKIIKAMFLVFREALLEAGIIDHSALFIDGTKILADANKYSFVWRNSSETFESRCDEDIEKLYQELIQDKVDLLLNEEVERHSSEQLVEVADQLEAEVSALTEEITKEKVVPGGSPRKRRRRKIKHYLHELKKNFLPRKQRYEKNNQIFGDRNSYSKTDHDATFMRMKEDPMLNGQLKPGFNLQVATQQQFALYYDLYQRPADQRTLIPFLEDHLDQEFEYIVADAGYGSERNYNYLADHTNSTVLIPYTMYEKEKSRKYQKDPSKRQNWEYDATDDHYIDQHGVKFHYQRSSTSCDKTGFTRNLRFYQAEDYGDPKGYHYSRTPKDNLRYIQVNPHWEAQKATIQNNLSEHQSLYGLRKIENEPFFGNLKANLKYRRTSVRGLRQVKNETGIAIMAANLIKLMLRGLFIFFEERQKIKMMKILILIKKFIIFYL